ncbi:MAG: rhomboid family intramembrane serine protease [Deltaproteobacteria bacterium]|nr:rhomboid family intramembrane serine protease [Deltaproteobacteria bacterium]
MVTPKKDDTDWVDRLSHLASLLGFNQVRVRWKLDRMRQRWRDSGHRARERVEHISYEHKVCGRCGRVNDRSEKRCAGCGGRLGGRLFNRLQRIGLGLPEVLSVSSLLGLAMVLVFGRMVLAEGGPDSFWSFRVDTLFRFGGHSPQAVLQGEWWRLATGIFLHAGLWHLGFNLFALSQIGPAIEEVFGRGRMILFFMLTGVLASFGSSLFRMDGVGIGASGAIMGLCGMAAGWGHRDGTTQGRAIRNLMMKWVVYTVVFGLLIGADNVAHLVGFGSGALVGFVFNPALLRRSPRAWVSLLQGLTGGGLAVAAFVLCLSPPASPMQKDFENSYPQGGNPYRPMLEVCRLYDLGQSTKALDAYKRAISGHGGQADALSLDQVGMTCKSLEVQRQQCKIFEEQGLDAILPKGGEVYQGMDRVDIERAWRGMCDWLEEKPAE